MYAFLPELYSVMKDVLPQQRDYLICDVSSDSSDVVVVKHGLLLSSAVQHSGVRNILDSVHNSGLSSHTIPVMDSHVVGVDITTDFQSTTSLAKNQWITEMKATFAQIAQEEPLPRMVCIVSEPAVSEFVKRLLDAPELRSLWLSDEPLSLAPLTPALFRTTLVSDEGSLHPFPLYVLALSSNRRYGA